MPKREMLSIWPLRSDALGEKRRPQGGTEGLSQYIIGTQLGCLDEKASLAPDDQ